MATDLMRKIIKGLSRVFWVSKQIKKSRNFTEEKPNSQQRDDTVIPNECPHWRINALK